MKRIFALIMTICLLSGCSLARTGKAGPDELVGFFVTVSLEENGTTVDIWDEEAAGMGMISDYTLAGQRLYAKRTDGAQVSYEFPAGCGLSCFIYDVFDEDGDAYRSQTVSAEIDVVNLAYHAGEPSRYELEGTLYATADTRAVIRMNPVYQTPNGDVYVLSDKPTGYQVHGGSGWSAFQTQEYAVDKGYTTYQGSTVTLSVEYVTLPETYVIIEMSEANEPLRQSEYAPGELPETYTPGADAAYLLLEARAGEGTVRSVYSPGDESVEMDTFSPGEYGFCIKGYTRIEWEDAE